MDYKSRLTHLQLLPLMYRLELYDIMFFVNSLTNLDNLGHFNILNYVTFSDSNTRSSSAYKLKHHTAINNLQRHSYFHRLPRLWNSLPPINPRSSPSTIKSAVHSHFLSHFTMYFDSKNTCTYHYLCSCNTCSAK